MLKRLFAILLSAILIFHPTWAMVIYAEGEEEQVTQVEQVEQVDEDGETDLSDSPDDPASPQSSPETSEDAIPTVTPFSSIETGDAESEATTETTTNYSENSLEGEVEIDDCEGGGEAECSIYQENEAEATSSAQASSTSGENTSVEPEGVVEIDTGFSTSEATTEDVINTDIVELENSDSPDLSGEASMEVDSPDDPDFPDGPSDQSDEESPAAIIHDNEADVDSEAQAESTSGENEAVGGAGASVETDDSHASANMVDLINTNIVGSNFEFIFGDIEDYEGDINLNEIWKALLAEKGAEASAILFSDFSLLIANFNKAKVQEDVSAQATSGDNAATSQTGPAEVTSGDSFASANLFRFINTNIVGSNFLFAVFNIFGNFSGNIVIPNRERFMEGNDNPSGLPPVFFTNNNFTQIDDQVLANATSGDNHSQTGGNQETETGDALAQASSINFTNTNMFNSYWYWLFLNNFGDWDGEILGWDQADSSQEPESGAAQMVVNNGDHQGDRRGFGESLNNPDNDPSLAVHNENWAEIEGFVSAEARSGGNRAESLTGDTKIKSGRAIALANLFSWVNTNILGGRFILPIINVFGRWQGNLISAHPDLVIGLSDGLDRVYPGDILDYTLVYSNQGYEDAREASVKIDLPHGLSYLLTKGGPEPEVNGNNLTYFLDNIAPGQSGSFVIQVQVDPDFVEKNGYHLQVSGKQTFLGSVLAKIIPPVNAVEDGLPAGEAGQEYEVSVTAEVGSFDADSNPDNNFAVSKTKVFVSNGEGIEGQEGQEGQKENGEGGPDVRMPTLYVSSWNNTGEFVYPEDIVTFELSLVNRGNGPASEIVVYQEVYNGDPLAKFTNSFYVGDLKINQLVELNFGLQVPAEVEPGVYYSRIWAVGKAPGGDEIISGDSLTNFKVKLKEHGIIKDIQAAEPIQTGDVAGSQVSCPPREEKKDLLPYILLLLVTSLWFTDRFKRKENKKNMAKAIKSFKGRFWKKL